VFFFFFFPPPPPPFHSNVPLDHHRPANDIAGLGAELFREQKRTTAHSCVAERSLDHLRRHQNLCASYVNSQFFFFLLFPFF
jgi:hypothetical protein